MTAEQKDLKIEILPDVQAKIDSDPKLASFMKNFQAILHQAHHAVATGQYKTMEDAIEAMTGHRPVKVDPESEEEIPGSLNVDMGLERQEPVQWVRIQRDVDMINAPPQAHLVLEIVKAAGGAMPLHELNEIVGKAVADFGGFAEALQAFRDGKFKVEPSQDVATIAIGEIEPDDDAAKG